MSVKAYIIGSSGDLELEGKKGRALALQVSAEAVGVASGKGLLVVAAYLVAPVLSWVCISL